MVEGFGVAAELMLDREVVALRNEAFAAGYSRVVRKLNEPGFRNVVVTKILAALLDGPGFLRQNILRWGIAAGDIGERRLSEPRWLSDTVRARTFGTYHAAGTCALGNADNPHAVVGPTTMVLGTDNLYVADASIMPIVPRGNTNLPVMMLAERASALILDNVSSTRRRRDGDVPR
jgi:5-(hydroxymethyl)furfural/furfural oxidase